jgi:hypothetical protein
MAKYLMAVRQQSIRFADIVVIQFQYKTLWDDSQEDLYVACVETVTRIPRQGTKTKQYRARAS